MSRSSAEVSVLHTDDVSIAARKTALRRGSFPVAVYGLGKIGLPVTAALADLTGEVTGVDVDASVVDAVNAGHSPLDHEPGLEEALSTAVAEGRCVATTDAAAAAEDASIHVIVVPIPLDDEHDADLAALRDVLEPIGDGLDPGDLVVVESTVPPGTAVDVVTPILAERSGIDPDRFGVASCPERTSSGRAMRDVRGAYPRVVGGVTPVATEAAFVVYDELVDNEVITVDARTAEAVKLFEGVYRDVNIALANELALAFDGTGIDVRAAIEAANTQPYCDIHTPGAGVGGHCIPWYPHFLRASTDRDMPLVATGRRVNDHMPTHIAERTGEELRRPAAANVCILGLAYRPEVPETAASPTVDLVDHLDGMVADVAVVDPLVDAPDETIDMLPLEDVDTYDPDAIVLMTAHEAFDALSPDVFADTVVIDGRDALDEPADYVVGSDP